VIECGKNWPWPILIGTLLFSGGVEENDESHQKIKRFWGLLANIEHSPYRRRIVNPLDHDIQQYWKTSLTNTRIFSQFLPQRKRQEINEVGAGGVGLQLYTGWTDLNIKKTKFLIITPSSAYPPWVHSYKHRQ